MDRTIHYFQERSDYGWYDPIFPGYEKIEKLRFPIFPRYEKTRKIRFPIFPGGEYLILNRVPYNSNFSPESIKIQLKIYNFH